MELILLIFFITLSNLMKILISYHESITNNVIIKFVEKY